MTQSSSKTPIRDYLNQIQCAEVKFVKSSTFLPPSVAVFDSQTLGDAFSVMELNQVREVPIVSSEGKPFLIISMKDILAELFHKLDMRELLALEGKALKENSKELFSQVNEKKRKFLDFPLALFIDKHLHSSSQDREGFVAVPGEMSLGNAIDLMREKRSKRIVTVDKNGMFLNLISLTHIMEVIIHSQLFPSLKGYSDSLEEISKEFPILKDVKKISGKAKTWEAFGKMIELGVESLGVVTEEGELSASISSEDLKVVGSDLRFLSLLNFPVEEFFASYSHPITKENSLNVRFDPMGLLLKKLKRPVLDCTLEDSFSFVVQMCRAFSVQRLFIINEKLNPIGVISLRDQLNVLLALK